ncbi:tail fiber protein [Salmonella enterica]|nr:tail fiber protein [Salmonella enterica]EIS6490610.1 tail fiber protein [Salmonella enterica]EIS6593065.1 tail fiber protein [Salmonella enterica]EIS6665781.1 tail fiber protein [Salmonella enterica]
MQDLMPPITTPDNAFHDGNPATGELGTIVAAEWLNNTQGAVRDIQAECIAILAEAGFKPNPAKKQLLDAIKTIVGNEVPAASTTQAGIVRLSSATDSDSETEAATPKAVKAAFDLAKGALAKDQNGGDIPDKQKFIENVGLTETVKQAAGAVPSTRKINNHALDKDLSLTPGDIGALPVTGGKLNGPLGIGTDNALGGNSIVLGDNDTGIKQNADGVLDFYANGQLVARIQPGTLFVINAVQAGDGKKLALSSNNNSALNAGLNLWGDGGNRPTVIELGDDQGWHLYSQRNPDGSIQFVVNGQVIPDNYGNFDARYVQNVQRGAPVSPGKIDEYGPAEAPAGCVLTNARHDPGTKYGVFTTYRPLQIYINGWRTIAG